ncbi:hypothetical protein ACFT2C_09040 [Promicromonospora sp. NPDC057138]
MTRSTMRGGTAAAVRCAPRDRNTVGPRPLSPLAGRLQPSSTTAWVRTA